MFLLSFGEFFNVYFWRINEVFARTSRRTTWPPSPEIKATELSILSNVSFWMISFSNIVVFVMTSFGTTQCCFQLKASRWLLQQCDVCYISPTLNYSTWPTNKINLTLLILSKLSLDFSSKNVSFTHHRHCLSKGEVSYHQKRLRGDEFFDFGRIPQWNCPIAGKSHPPWNVIKSIVILIVISIRNPHWGSLSIIITISIKMITIIYKPAPQTWSPKWSR